MAKWVSPHAGIVSLPTNVDQAAKLLFKVDAGEEEGKLHGDAEGEMAAEAPAGERKEAREKTPAMVTRRRHKGGRGGEESGRRRVIVAVCPSVVELTRGGLTRGGRSRDIRRRRGKGSRCRGGVGIRGRRM